MPRGRRLPSEPTNTDSSLSQAERYINIQAQMLDLNNPLSDTRSTASSGSTNTMSHAQIMQNWRDNKCNERSKDNPHQYKYGPPPPPSSNNPTLQRANSQPNRYRQQTFNPSSSIDHKQKK